MKIWFCATTLLFAALSPLAHAANADAGKSKAAACGACHGADGKALLAENPNLAGQGSKYLIKQLQEFKSGVRENAIMQGMASPLSDEDMADIAAYYESLPPVQGVANTEHLQLGEDIYRGGITSIGIPACSGCHSPTGKGNPAAGYPQLSGQNSSYLYTTLQHFRAGTRANDANGIMRGVAHRLSNEEIAAVSNYIQGLK